MWVLGHLRRTALSKHPAQGVGAQAAHDAKHLRLGATLAVPERPFSGQLHMVNELRVHGHVGGGVHNATTVHARTTTSAVNQSPNAAALSA